MNKKVDKIIRKVFLFFVGVIVFATVTDINSYAAENHAGEWMQDSDGYWWYEFSDGTYANNEWLVLDGNTYWFDEDGYMATGWVELTYVDSNTSKEFENWFHFGNDGVLSTGWVESNGWYYMDANGIMLTGWQNIDSSWYLFGEDGIMEYIVGWQKVGDGTWQYFNWNGDMETEKQDITKTMVGIDVSTFQSDIDWSEAKDFGVEYAFIRLGYKGSVSRTNVLDGYYATNMDAAYEAGIPVGVYFYSLAMNAEEAIAEAQFVIDNLEGYTVSYPVAIDLEDASQSAVLSKSQITEIAQAFCDEIEKAGYTPMVYCNENWANNYVDLDKVENAERWVARYDNFYNENIERDIWQSGSTAIIDGIEGDVDINFGYTDYSKIITPRTAADESYEKTVGIWKLDDMGYWYAYIQGGYPMNEWELIDEKWYWFDSVGYVVGGDNWIYDGADWYYTDIEQNLVSGWKLISDNWYYFDQSGRMATGWSVVNNRWYYFGNSNDGAMKTGWQYINGNWYYFGNSDDGAMKTGWQYIDSNWYYMGEFHDGAMKTGWQLIDGKWYYMYDSGAMAKDTTIGDYYVDYNGVMR